MNARTIILTLCLGAGVALRAQQAFTPHVGYVYPAGGEAGTTFTVKVGGQFLQTITNVFISGTGVQASIVKYERPMSQKEANELRQKVKDLLEQKASKPDGWTPAQRQMLREIREKLQRFQRRSPNPAISETVTLRLAISPGATVGERELRLGTATKLTEPLNFIIDRLPEFQKPEPLNEETDRPAFRRRNENVQRAVDPVDAHVRLPCVINGQVLPGGVDRYHFQARRGQRLVVSVAARELVPYLADAVPGWFQAAVSIFDAQGHEVAYADHYQFHPDPVLFYEVPKDCEYVLQIRDSIYRGREDFVYRITAGELPFITGIFPLGEKAGEATMVQLTGWNLPKDTIARDDRATMPGIHEISVASSNYLSNKRPFLVGTLPECLSGRFNHSAATAQRVTLPTVVNGRIAEPGQWDVFRFDGNAGEEIVAEVMARRLESPLDSVLRLTDASGKELAFNDDYEDKSDGLHTQHADSYLRVKLPASGTYYVYLGDVQQQGGPDYAYRLRLGAARPDFALRVVPSSLSLRSGMASELTVHVFREDGCTNEIAINLKGAPAGFVLSGGTIAPGQEQARMTLSAPPFSAGKTFKLSLEGRAFVDSEQVIRPVVPADDRMQAFAYHHLVPADDLEVSVLGRPQMGTALAILDRTPIKLPSGGTAKVRVRVPGRAANNFQLELSDPPAGISLLDVVPGEGEATLAFHCDSAKTKPGTAGNLIVNIVARKARGNTGGKARSNQAQFVIGSLPAIPFQIVPSQVAVVNRAAEQ